MDDALTYQERVVGCLLAGAVGDALGGPVEFLSAEQIRERFGPDGPDDYAPAFGLRGGITDDTQMTLFTLEGLIRAHVRFRTTKQLDVPPTVHRAYLRWLYTQDEPVDRTLINGTLVVEPALFAERAPGNTCLSALGATSGGGRLGTVEQPINNSKGCGGVMRAAPCALWPDATPGQVFRLGADVAALTHGHPSGYLSAGTFAVMVHQLLHGAELPAALDRATEELVGWPAHEEQLTALRAARSLAAQGRPGPDAIEARLGGGWVGEEALAIAVCAALVATDLADGLRLAVNHSGDSDSTGAICGNLLGAMHGEAALPDRLRDHVELSGLIRRLCADAAAEFGPTPPTGHSWFARYPPE